MKKTLSSGFTLVEVMVVVAILGILTSVAIPNFKKYQEKAKKDKAQRQNQTGSSQASKGIVIVKMASPNGTVVEFVEGSPDYNIAVKQGYSIISTSTSSKVEAESHTYP